VKEFFERYRREIERELHSFFQAHEKALRGINPWGDDLLKRFQRFSVQGKMIRGGLIILSYLMFRTDLIRPVLQLAAAIEIGLGVDSGLHDYLTEDPHDVQGILKVLVEAERCAVRQYTNVCNLTAGKDHRTYDLSLAILNEEIEHESWFSEFLGEGPSGHFMRRGETSPFVSKFLK